MEIPITALFTGLLTLWYLRITVPIFKEWQKENVSLGAGDDSSTKLYRFVRTHANFTEYITLSLFIMALLEWHGLNDIYLYIIGLSLLIGRILHAKGINNSVTTWHIIGTTLTLWPLGIGAFFLIYIWVLQTWLL